MPQARNDDETQAPPRVLGFDAAASVAGRFELLAELGRGSSGTVWRARLVVPYADLPAGSEVAIKFLRVELAADERAHARLFAEGELGQQLRHPNVAAIHGVESAEHRGIVTSYLVMQYIHGTTLRDFVARSGAPVEDLTRRIGADAAKGLSALHRRGLARPFGSSGAGSGSGSGSNPSGTAGSRTSGLGLAGSVAYAAPELLRGGAAGPKSDLYSLGVVLYEVTTGKHPFATATTPDEMLDAHLHRAPSPPSHLRPRVSPFLEQVLLDLLRKEPDERPRDALDLARILEQGERSEYWRRHEAKAPALASGRRLLRMRRPAETPFCGREAELQALDEALAAARTGKGRVVVVAGPEGIGRRRLLDETMQRWLDRQAPPLYLGGEADSDLGHAEPFASSLLDWLLRGDDAQSPNAPARAAVAARTLLSLDEANADALAAVATGHSTEPPEVRAERLASALLALPKAGQPLVLRVDHADELDTSGRLVLQRLAGAASQKPLLVLLACGHQGVAVELPAAQRHDLAGLDLDDFLAFGRALWRDGEAADDFLARAHQVLSGVPGALLEALDHMVQEGDLRGRAGDYHGLRGDAEPRPAPGLLDRFRARVASLGASQRAVLAAAAVLGERVALADLAALVQATELSVLETLSLFRGRIVRAQGGEVSFRHRDFQKLLLLDLPAAERQALHLRAAELLAARGAPPLVVGMHRSYALDHEGCLDPLLDALDERVRAGSRRTALRLASRLAVHLPQVPATPANEHRRLRYLLLSGQARANAEQIDAASKWFQQAETLARTLGDRDRSAAARLGLATAELDSGRLLSSIALLEALHDDLAHRHDDTADALAAQAHGLHGRILLYRGQASDGLRHLQAALKRLPARDEDLRCHLLLDLARVEALSHHYGKALRTLHEVEQAPATKHRPRVRLRFHLYRGQVRALVGDDDASQDLRLAIAEAEQLALPTYGARAAVFLGERRFWKQRDDRALEAFRMGLRLALAGRDRLGEAMARCYLLRLGDEDDTLPALVDELALPLLHANLLLANAARGRWDDDTVQNLEALLANADLPLSLHLRALAWLARPASARSLVRAIAERFPQRAARHRFLAQWSGEARV